MLACLEPQLITIYGDRFNTSQYLFWMCDIIQDIHPFYAHLINILFQRDHYKIALGNLNMARHKIDE